MAWTIDDIFELLQGQQASDVVFAPGSPPAVWVAGRMRHAPAASLTGEDVEQTFGPLLNETQRATLEACGDLDLSVGRRGHGRCRINLHRQRGTLAAAVRFIPFDVPSFERLHLPQRILDLAELPRGLVLVTGGAGTGKSTTLAAMIEHLNHERALHVITLEDPVEFVFTHRRCLIEQREIGVDCPSFASALRHVVRQRPDAILVGEMRDQETIAAALTAAETGHLVFASLHTNSAVETVNRVVDVFPAGQQAQVRVQLSDTLQGVACQTLLPAIEGERLVPAVEIMICTEAIRRAIRDGETHLLRGMIETGKAQGMQTMDAAIAALVRSRQVEPQDAMARAQVPEALARMIA